MTARGRGHYGRRTRVRLEHTGPDARAHHGAHAPADGRAHDASHHRADYWCVFELLLPARLRCQWQRTPPGRKRDLPAMLSLIHNNIVPTQRPTQQPSVVPTKQPTQQPTTAPPTQQPTQGPTQSPTL